jgi:16S rRNA (adenine1518-N6/adenine1519-N6)-dimethyltransferase
VELDDRFAPKLAALRIRYPHLDVVIGDFLKIDLPEIASPAVSWTVVANIPYYITALIIEKLIGEGRGFIREAYLLVQEEVARRIVSRGGRESGAVSIYVQYHARPEIMMIVPPEAFSPPPMVRSALLHLSFLDAPPVEVREESFFTVVGIAFRSRRKMLRNSLAVLPWAPDQGEIEEALKAAGIDPRARPESLDLEDFARLSRSLDLPEIQPRL